LPAMGLAAAVLLSGGRSSAEAKAAGPGSPIAGLVAAFYVGWLIQAVALQHLFDYIHAPGVLLAILTCVAVARSRARCESPDFAGNADCGAPMVQTPVAHPECGGGKSVPSGDGRTRRRIWPDRGCLWRVGLTLFVVLASLCSPALRTRRLACWLDCVRQGSSPEVRDRLSLMQFPHWRDLERVASFLRSCRVRNGDVCCFPNSTIHLYEMLEIRPPTRYVYLENTLVFFPEREETLRAALAAAAPRYTVTDLVSAGVRPDAPTIPGRGSIPPDVPLAREEPPRVFPWQFPIVFRAGRYAVHRTVGSIGRLELAPGGPLTQVRPATKERGDDAPKG
jgi:hypothetical protein